MRFAENLSTPELLRELAEIKEGRGRSAFGTDINLATLWWQNEVTNELRGRNVLD